MTTRRRFLASCAATAALPQYLAKAAGAEDSFTFILLGDLHFDRLEHHDMKWLQEHKAGDLSQIQNYSRLTAEVMPKVFTALKTEIAQLRGTGTPPAFVLQVGDLVEGLCGTAELAATQNREALEFVAQSELGLPFVFTKGNHDVTGDGALEAFNSVLQPFMTQQARLVDAKSTPAAANYTITHGDCEFAFFDAYDKASLEWFEAAAAARTARHLFVTVHPPVVPYGARATWHLFAGEKEKAKREKMLAILGKQEAMVLGGHLHKFSSLTRTAGGKQFTQLAISSVVSEPNQKVRDALHGIGTYNGDQVKLEPKHAPETVEQRRAIYESERKEVTAFEYADTAGYAVVTVTGNKVEAKMHSGTSRDAFQTVRLAG